MACPAPNPPPVHPKLSPLPFDLHPQSASSKHGDGDPSFAFRNTPPLGARPPSAPQGLRVQPVGNGSVVLSWAPPAKQQVDLYVINITQVIRGMGWGYLPWKP